MRTILLLAGSLAAGAALATGCGARSGLLSGSLADASPPDDAAAPFEDSAVPPPDEGAPCFDAGSPPPKSGCTSAIGQGATPIDGYCSTRAHVASTFAPRAPKVAWSVQLETNLEPVELVADPKGVVYATVDTLLDDDELFPNALVAVTPCGTIAWTEPYPNGVSKLFVGSDGRLRATAGLTPGPQELIAVDAAGNAEDLGSLPKELFGPLAVGSDGSLYGMLSDVASQGDDRVVKLTPLGARVWATPIDATCPGCETELALTQGDRVVVATLVGDGGTITSVRELDETGAVAWETGIEGVFDAGPAIALDGSIRVAVIITGMPAVILYSLSAEGSVLWKAVLDSASFGNSGPNLVIAPDGTTVVQAPGNLFAVDNGGHVLWQRAACQTCASDTVLDPGNRLLVLDVVEERIAALDLADGRTEWTAKASSQDGGTIFFPNSFILGASGSVVGASSGGVLTLSRDPD